MKAKLVIFGRVSKFKRNIDKYLFMLMKTKLYCHACLISLPRLMLLMMIVSLLGRNILRKIKLDILISVITDTGIAKHLFSDYEKVQM